MARSAFLEAARDAKLRYQSPAGGQPRVPQIGGAPDGLPPSAPYHASRPVSRVLYGAKQTTHFARDGHSSGTPVARRLEQPTRAADPDIDPGIAPRAAPIRSCS